jgi:hypothetical protein
MNGAERLFREIRGCRTPFPRDQGVTGDSRFVVINPKVDAATNDCNRVDGDVAAWQSLVATVIELRETQFAAVALSRLKHGFESRWGIEPVFLAIEDRHRHGSP